MLWSGIAPIHTPLLIFCRASLWRKNLKVNNSKRKRLQVKITTYDKANIEQNLSRQASIVLKHLPVSS